MAHERGNAPEQERSIKEREKELFVARQAGPVAKPPVKPFALYLRETPADPMSMGVKVLLWAVGILVLLLFAAALWRIQRRTGRPPRAPAPAATALAPGIEPHGPGVACRAPGVAAESGAENKRACPIGLSC
jgi:hypothetical protein